MGLVIARYIPIKLVEQLSIDVRSSNIADDLYVVYVPKLISFVAFTDFWDISNHRKGNLLSGSWTLITIFMCLG